MTVRSECYSKGHRLLRFYQYVYELRDGLNTVPTALRPNAMIAAIKQVDIDIAKGEVESLFRTGAISEKTYHGFRARLQDIEGALPALIEPELPKSQIENRLERSSNLLDTLQFEAENILFQEIAKCECGGKRPE